MNDSETFIYRSIESDFRNSNYFKTRFTITSNIVIAFGAAQANYRPIMEDDLTAESPEENLETEDNGKRWVEPIATPKIATWPELFT